MVKNTKAWISWEWNITFLWNKKILNLCFRWHILKSYCFVAEVTFKLLIFFFKISLLNKKNFFSLPLSNLTQIGTENLLLLNNFYKWPLIFVCLKSLWTQIFVTFKKIRHLGLIFFWPVRYVWFSRWFYLLSKFHVALRYLYLTYFSRHNYQSGYTG